ncbi:hypothetical protein PAXRUDRAFT_18229 [Paxillus rubicundulus Ve08.2h10]|uniref:Uncharacterized protein n=1 Tax=Paxillus rubicundulus Ve08.2h10 TaxID=930991 RepID=A0A0D0D805_9AGAM|nr:hypothetical protein PAXRUDRAFT_18424 [Paxillus rubicundulus Ve08.2h10]KIK76395.1 hypothetical protein PAXRUDRAFT_18254 [Paxillus rubicundulus Ve08.2h10]KIK76429.1 hypothetical protein PAXRUDRAFT_18229 [Paxillus rubicundulus Ve08.2h10]
MGDSVEGLCENEEGYAYLESQSGLQSRSTYVSNQQALTPLLPNTEIPSPQAPLPTPIPTPSPHQATIADGIKRVSGVGTWASRLRPNMSEKRLPPMRGAKETWPQSSERVKTAWKVKVMGI